MIGLDGFAANDLENFRRLYLRELEQNGYQYFSDTSVDRSGSTVTTMDTLAKISDGEYSWVFFYLYVTTDFGMITVSAS